MNHEYLKTRFVTGGVILLVGLAALADNLLEDAVMAWVWIAAMAISALAFGWAYSRTREGSAAVGAYVTAAIGLVVLLVGPLNMDGVIVPVLVLSLIGLPFLFVGLRNPQERGLLIPAYVMFAIALLLIIPEAAINQLEELVPAYVMAAIALPFFFVALTRHQYGLLIPGGIMLAISLFFVGTFVGLSPQVFTLGVPVVLILVGGFLLLSRSSDHKKVRH